MTEVVTNTAAFVQPLLYAARHQAFGVSNQDSPQSELTSALAASQQQAASDATQVAPASDDRSSLASGDDGSQSNRSFANQLPQRSLAASDAAAQPSGPAKARVEISVLDIPAEPAVKAASLQAAPVPEAPAPQSPQPAPLSFGSLAGGAAGPLQAPVEAPRPQALTGVLGPAAVVRESDLANISQNIFGAAFAPTQLAQPAATQAPTQTQKNFIFAQRKLFNDDVAAPVQASGKFTPAETKVAVFGADATAGKFAAPTVAVAAATVGAQFAASAESAQRLYDKVGPAASGKVEPTTGDVRLYDKVPQADTQNQQRDQSADDQRGEFAQQDSRQSLYQRAQAVAQALGEKSSNPAVKKLIATLESYGAVTGVGRRGRPTVRVIA